jgi:4-hydroxy-tetrahydrodipicolinate reductase
MVKSSTSLIVHGATGRMGARIVALASEDPSVRIVGAVARAGSPRLGTESGAPGVRIAIAPNDSDMAGFQGVLIDFSSDEGAMHAAALARGARCALLVGTTGLSERTIAALRETAAVCPVLLAPNTSLGVAVAAKIISELARALGPGFECSIVEAHHNRKKDAPSGTAIRLAVAVRSAGHELRDDQVVSIRGGDVIGEHTVRFAGPGEYIELTHRATTRDLFALGAIRAAKWLSQRRPGWYTIEDTLGIAS